MHLSWHPILEGAENIIPEGDFLPERENLFRAFDIPFDDVRVLIVGQDPYPTPGHAMGLAFSTSGPIPRSLANIYKELNDDLGIPTPDHGDLSSWQDQGVMLLNRVLTVAPGQPGSHRGIGWEEITEKAITSLAKRDQPLVAILWGADARKTRKFLGDTPVIESAHPSPLSARRGFFGSQPFSRTNALLQAQGAEPIDWNLK